jgi:hypothetical protein
VAFGRSHAAPGPEQGNWQIRKATTASRAAATVGRLLRNQSTPHSQHSLARPTAAIRDSPVWVRWRPSEKENCVGSMRSAEKPRRRRKAQGSPERAHSPAADHRLRAVRWNRQHVHRVRIDLKDRVSEPDFAYTPPGSQPGECQTPRWYLDVDYLRNSGRNHITAEFCGNLWDVIHLWLSLTPLVPQARKWKLNREPSRFAPRMAAMEFCVVAGARNQFYLLFAVQGLRARTPLRPGQ